MPLRSTQQEEPKIAKVNPENSCNPQMLPLDTTVANPQQAIFKSRSNQIVIYFSSVFTLYSLSVISGHTSVTFLSQYLCGCDFSFNNHVSFVLSHIRHLDINPLTNIQQILDLQHILIDAEHLARGASSHS